MPRDVEPLVEDFRDQYSEEVYKEVLDEAGHQALSGSADSIALPRDEQERFVFALYELLENECLQVDPPCVDGLTHRDLVTFLQAHAATARALVADFPSRGFFEERTRYPDLYPPREIDLWVEIDEAFLRGDSASVITTPGRAEDDDGCGHTVDVAVVPERFANGNRIIPAEPQDALPGPVAREVDYVFGHLVEFDLGRTRSSLSSDSPIYGHGFADGVNVETGAQVRVAYAFVDPGCLKEARDQLSERVREGWPQEMPAPEWSVLLRDVITPFDIVAMRVKGEHIQRRIDAMPAPFADQDNPGSAE